MASPPALPGDVKELALAATNNAISQRLALAESWDGQRVWIDPELANYVAPFQQRKVSDGLLNVARGTHLPMGDAPAIRLFVYWKQPPGETSDLDLSAVTFDRYVRPLGQVSWTRLRDKGITHSGDITSAPKGAAEFMDIELAQLGSRLRYIAPQIYRYAGPPFSGLDKAHAGWMMRQTTKSKDAKVFDISTVQNVFDLLGSNAYSLPFVADVRERTIIYTDLYIGSRQAHNQVEESESSVAAICDEVRHFTTNRVTIHDVAVRNAAARGAAITEDRSTATITIGTTADCTLCATDVASINAELLV